MNVLVTGGTGYLGSHVVRRLLAINHHVLCLILRGDPCDALADIASNLQYANTDDSMLDSTVQLFKPDAVIHMATVYERGNVTLNDVFCANLAFPFSVLELAIHAGAKKWINCGSVLPAGTNGYSLSKSQFVEWGKLEADRGRIAFVNLMMEHFYGPDGPDTHFLTWVVKKLKKNEPLDLTSGVQHRDFVYVDDVVNAFVTMLNKDINDYVEIQIGTGEAPAIRDVVTYLKEITRSSSELRFGAVPLRKNEPESIFNPSSMQMYQLSCKYSWREGMNKII